MFPKKIFNIQILEDMKKKFKIIFSEDKKNFENKNVIAILAGLEKFKKRKLTIILI